MGLEDQQPNNFVKCIFSKRLVIAMALGGTGGKISDLENQSDTVPSCLIHQLFYFTQGTLQISQPWLVKVAIEKILAELWETTNQSFLAQQRMDSILGGVFCFTLWNSSLW